MRVILPALALLTAGSTLAKPLQQADSYALSSCQLTPDVINSTASPAPVIATFDRNSSATGQYSNLNTACTAALNAPSQGLTDEHQPTGTKGAVATELDVCSNVGADLLKAGGSAADAIIGAALCVGVTSTFHSNIGGGGYALVRSVSEAGGAGKYEMIDFRETMPALGNETMYTNNTNPKASTVGGLSVGVPGEIRGWELLHQRHGKLPWKKLFEPAIAIANCGFRVPSQLSVVIKSYESSFICRNPLAAEVYCPNGTKAVGEGEIIRKPRYALTLQTIAEQGADAFYYGRIATNTIQAVQASGGIMTLSDLAGYKAILREPNSIVWNGKYKVVSTVAPSSGTVVLSALKTIDAYNADKNASADLSLHRLIEATKFGYGERTDYADPDFVNNVTALEKEFLSDEHTQKKKALIKDDGVLPIQAYDPRNYTILTDDGTSQLTVIDKDGNSVSLTTTVNLIWGSQVITSDGILLNDEMDDFSSPNTPNAFGFQPSSANFIRPGKRPLSSISPVMAEDAQTGQIVFSLGSAGGSRIITANIINSHNLLASEGQINIQQSLAMPRWHDQLAPHTTVLEWAASYPQIPGWVGFSNTTAAYLTSVGHNVTYAAPGSSTAQGVQRFSNGTFLGGAEVRQLSARAAAV